MQDVGKSQISSLGRSGMTCHAHYQLDEQVLQILLHAQGKGKHP